MRYSSILFCFIGWVNILIAQDTVYLNNASFEDLPRKGGEIQVAIKGWEDCGLIKFPEESPPDILPTRDKAWRVIRPAFDGKTYLSLVVRETGTWEMVSQQLEHPLTIGNCYSFYTLLSTSEVYKSGTPLSYKLEDFTTPAILLIWGGHDECDQKTLLAQSQPVGYTDWKLNKFILRPDENYKFITIAAFFKFPHETSYNGHILIDVVSPIIQIECE